jgi:hypothetical protein
MTKIVGNKPVDQAALARMAMADIQELQTRIASRGNLAGLKEDLRELALVVAALAKRANQ